MKISYTCGECKGSNVQLSFPVWVDANNIDNKDKWEMDYEAVPEEDSNKCWCLDCKEHVSLTRHEKKTGGSNV